MRGTASVCTDGKGGIVILKILKEKHQQNVRGRESGYNRMVCTDF